VIVAWSAIAGFMAGFTRVGIGFAATVLGILFGMWFYYVPAEWIRDYIASETGANLIGFFVILIGFVFIGALIGRILAKMLKLVGLSFLDRLGGAAFGFVRGAVVGVGVVTVVTAFAPEPAPRFILESKVLPYASTASSVMAWLAPRAMKDAYHQSLDKIRRTWDEHDPRKQAVRTKQSPV
jgi:membrane protein required for colicin V production